MNYKRVKLYKVIVLYLLIAITTTSAQNNSIFNGGVADGSSMGCFTQANSPLIGNNTFRGGVADGVALGCFMQGNSVLIGNLIFRGGIADGHTMACYIQPHSALIGGDIFKGGFADGFSTGCYMQPHSALIGNDIFRGGIADGFTFGSVGGFGFEVPLPVELLSFDAVPVNNQQVFCQWSTLSEVNNDFFTVQHSTDNLLFEDVGTVDGAGTSNAINTYTLNDYTPFPGVSYYRVKQTDFDGAFIYSASVAVNLISGKNAVIKVFPNPMIETSYLLFNADVEVSNALIEICDVQGKLVFSKKLNELRNMGNTIYTLNKENLQPGIYFLILTGTSILETNMKLIIQ